MRRGQATPVNLVIGLLVGNLAYRLFTVILSMILGVAPTEIFTGSFSEAANSLLSGWVAIGALLGATDVLVVAGFVSSVFGDR